MFDKLNIGDYIATSVAIYKVTEGPHFLDLKILKHFKYFKNSTFTTSYVTESAYDKFLNDIKIKGDILRILYGP